MLYVGILSKEAYERVVSRILYIIRYIWSSSCLLPCYKFQDNFTSLRSFKKFVITPAYTGDVCDISDASAGANTQRIISKFVSFRRSAATRTQELI